MNESESKNAPMNKVGFVLLGPLGQVPEEIPVSLQMKKQRRHSYTAWFEGGDDAPRHAFSA